MFQKENIDYVNYSLPHNILSNLRLSLYDCPRRDVALKFYESCKKCPEIMKIVVSVLQHRDQLLYLERNTNNKLWLILRHG